MRYFQVPLSWDNTERKGNFTADIWFGGQLLTEKELTSRPEFLIERELSPQRTHTSFGVRFSSDEKASLADLPSFKVRKQIASELAKIRLNQAPNSEKCSEALHHVYYGGVTTYFHLLDRNDVIAVQAILDSAVFMFASLTEQDYQTRDCRRVAMILRSWFDAYKATRGDSFAATMVVRKEERSEKSNQG